MLKVTKKERDELDLWLDSEPDYWQDARYRSGVDWECVVAWVGVPLVAWALLVLVLVWAG